MRTLTLAAAVAATLLSPAAASAAEPVEDWRSQACIDEGRLDAPGPFEQADASGPATLVASNRVPVDGLPGVRVGVDRLDFSGVTCEVLYVDGALGRDAEIDVVGNSWCASFDRSVGGTDLGPSQSCAGIGIPARLYDDGWTEASDDVMVLSVRAYHPHHSKVLKKGPGIPARWVGKTMTSDHLGSRWRVELAGTTGERHEFTRSKATDRAARAAYAQDVARAARAFETRVEEIERTGRSIDWKAWKIDEARAVRRDALAVARKTKRLALDGVRLVVRDVRSSNRGRLPRGLTPRRPDPRAG